MSIDSWRCITLGHIKKIGDCPFLEEELVGGRNFI